MPGNNNNPPGGNNNPPGGGNNNPPAGGDNNPPDSQQTPDASSNYQAFSPPTQQAQIGMNASFVYGENISGGVGISEQVVLGSLIQVTVNPAALAEAFSYNVVPPAVAAVAGGGSGGYMQFTVGTTTQVNMGRQYSISLGKKVNIDFGDASDPRDPSAKVYPSAAKTAAKIMSVLIGAATLAWLLAYNAYGDDEDSRAECSLISETILNGLIALFVTIESAFDAGDKAFWTAQSGVFVVKGTKLRQGATKFLNAIAQLVIAALASGVALEALILPAIQSSKGESHWLTNVGQEVQDPSQIWDNIKSV